MTPYTLDDNLQFGYGAGLFNGAQKTEPNSLWCSYSRATRIPTSFSDECVRTAELVKSQADAHKRPVYVLLSGGLDSEVTAKAFVEAGIDFQPITFRFPNKLNEHELVYVRKFCDRHGLEPQYYDLDIKSWATSQEAKELFVNSQAHFYEMVPHMKLLDVIWHKYGGMPVMGNGDLFMEQTETGWQYIEFEYILAWFRHAIHSKILGGIGFFQHTPEMTLAALRDPQMEKIGFGTDVTANTLLKDGRMAKYVMYRKHWPDLERRPKFNGGELLHKFYHELAEPLRQARTVQFNDKWTMPYAQFRAMHEPT